MARSHLLLAIILALATAAQSKVRSITESQARELVLTLLQSGGYNTSTGNFELDELHDPSFPDLILFEARVNNLERFDAAGEYVVDPRTADVQEMNTCVSPTAPIVVKFQAQLRKSIGLSISEYQKIKKRRPLPCFK